MRMKVEQIAIKNFKLFKNAEVRDLPEMCVFLGANGTGKSTFFDVFGFLSDALRENVSTAINKRGGFKEVISRGCTDKDLIEFEVKFRNYLEDKKSPLITYQLKVGLKDNKPYVEKEMLRYRREQRGAPWKFLDFSEGKGTAIKNEEAFGTEGAKEDREEQQLSAKDILAIKGLGQFERFKAISQFRKLLEGWYVSNLQIEAGKTIGDVGVSQHLNSRGENLAQVAKFMYENHRSIFDAMLQKMSNRVPGVEKVEAVQTEAGQIILKFKDGSFKDPFISRYVSDGTIKMFAYLVLLNDPEPHPLLCIEEPENYLYPKLLEEIAEELREYSRRGGQVFVTTHSPDFVNSLELDELFYIVKQADGFSVIKRAKDNEVVSSLFEAGDKLGALWQRGYLQEEGLK